MLSDSSASAPIVVTWASLVIVWPTAAGSTVTTRLTTTFSVPSCTARSPKGQVTTDPTAWQSPRSLEPTTKRRAAGRLSMASTPGAGASPTF